MQACPETFLSAPGQVRACLSANAVCSAWLTHVGLACYAHQWNPTGPLSLLQAPEEVIQLHADLRAYDKLGQAHLQTALRSVAALAEMGSSTRPRGQGTSAADLDRMQVMQTLTDAANQFNQVGVLKSPVLCTMFWVKMSFAGQSAGVSSMKSS